MKVTLFADMKAENWPSMDRYAQSLVSQLKVQHSRFKVFDVEPPLNSSKVKMFWRNQVYPLLAKFNQGDVNHVLDQSYAHLLKFLEPKKTVVTCHDLTPLEFEKDALIREEFRRTVENLSQAALVMADSQATKNDLINFLNLSGNKIEVVHLGVDYIFHPFSSLAEREEARKKFNLPEGKIVFSHGKSDLAYKNTEGIIESFAKVLVYEPKLYLLRVNPLTTGQRDLIKALGMEPRYLEIKEPTDEGLVALYNCADVFLAPSFKEGFGFPVLQALACATPVVISAGGSLEEIAGDCGVYVNPRDADDIARGVRQVLDDDSFRANNQEKMVKRARLFSWQETARKTNQVYEKVNQAQL